MDFAQQHPSLHNMRSLVASVAKTLEEMHAQQRAHGDIEATLKHCLNESKDALDGENFKARALPTDELPVDALQDDVQTFVACTIKIIRGETSEVNASFQANLHRGGDWPEGFLTLLEEASTQEVSISDLSQALDSNSNCAKSAEETASDTATTTPPAEQIETETPPKPLTSSQPVVKVALRNATVGKPYEVEPGAIATAIATQRGDRPEYARVSHLQLPDNCGLVFDEMTGRVAGTPTHPFDGVLSLDYVPSRSAQSIPYNVSLLINPDPASLWKDLPSPTNAPYPKEPFDHSEETQGPFRVVAASRRGRSHANRGEFRDDDFAIGYASDTGWLVIAVADGAGSATYSRAGSKIASAAAKQRLVTVLNSRQHNKAEILYSQHQDWEHPEIRVSLCRILYEAALKAHYELQSEVSNPSDPLPTAATLRNYDTTLIVLVLKKINEGCVAATFAIGDGGAGLLPNPEEGFPITRPEGGDYAGQTCFLTMPEPLKDNQANLERHFHFTVQKEFCAALAMTDGITDPKFPSDAAFADPAQWSALWTELHPALSSSETLLEWMNFFSPGNHDDRTLVAVLPAHATSAPNS
ncbi:MAG: protein phosphatase 2C domain-containing protein [Verrucomicrobiales bacterium]|nr:protein phosphatase 2C domain-containing protein [Verrucomicrobiales bacterium]